MTKICKLNVYYHGENVGTLALHKNRLAAFAYDKKWIENGFSISPYSLPLDNRVFIPKIDPFDGVYGVFSDSLPDGWGRLIVDRLLAQNGINPMQMGNLDRLAIVGQSGMGALEYEPVWNIENKDIMLSYDEIAKECKKILHEEMSQQLDYLFKNGGSSGGARPKILTTVDGEEWIVKFPSSGDSKNIGKQEYDYALCAKECQIEMEEVRLFSSKLCDGYFGTRRFDRNGENKIHMVSASGLLETSHRIPNLDYDILMKLTLQLTKDMSECQKLFKIMCFNVFAHNRDDHSKNFTYQYLEKEKRWVLSPAYDLTYSNSLGGEHATMVHGEGKNPTMQNIMDVAKQIGIDTAYAKHTALQIQEIVQSRLKQYL